MTLWPYVPDDKSSLTTGHPLVALAIPISINHSINLMINILVCVDDINTSFHLTPNQVSDLMDRMEEHSDLEEDSDEFARVLHTVILEILGDS